MARKKRPPLHYSANEVARIKDVSKSLVLRAIREGVLEPDGLLQKRPGTIASGFSTKTIEAWQGKVAGTPDDRRRTEAKRTPARGSARRRRMCPPWRAWRMCICSDGGPMPGCRASPRALTWD